MLIMNRLLIYSFSSSLLFSDTVDFLTSFPFLVTSLSQFNMPNITTRRCESCGLLNLTYVKVEPFNQGEPYTTSQLSGPAEVIDLVEDSPMPKTTPLTRCRGVNEALHPPTQLQVRKA